ncbi:energy-coupling factor ABC transporter permease [Crenobacter sp. SG2305]|uniref:energy-coupling factor ABC transporter permease n=1 Tax=Crenobacter oryzisoli TaxID=3056844 RepID=UPI0025AAC284|nr:energy-coupling factor ABC transporter permease [Crenobacter sp. SG2305]MDN0083999.1 energy-coupling factor ABC transporter permease [Crenobacter sp. SG2305]
MLTRAMNFTAALFSPSILLIADLLAGGVLGLAVWRVHWRRLPPAAMNAWLGATVLTMVMWMVRGGYLPGLNYHLLGATVLTLMMGPWLALLALALVMLVSTAYGLGDWQAAGLSFLISVVPPVTLSAVALKLTERFLPPNLFVYILGNGFLAGGASFFVSGACGVLALALAGAYPSDLLFFEALPFYFLLSWSEAFTSGLLTAILVVYRPHWMATFDDVRYLNDKSDD